MTAILPSFFPAAKIFSHSWPKHNSPLAADRATTKKTTERNNATIFIVSPLLTCRAPGTWPLAEHLKIDFFFFVIPAKAGIQVLRISTPRPSLDAGLRRHDGT